MENVHHNSHAYDDIIDLPHHVSSSHPHMPRIDRAAQFAPFSALSGFGAAIHETGRQTDIKIGLCEDEKNILDRKMRVIQEQIADHPKIMITYFQPDDLKDGGSYNTVLGRVKKIDTHGRMVIMQDGTRVPVDEILEIEYETALNPF